MARMSKVVMEDQIIWRGPNLSVVLVSSVYVGPNAGLYPDKDCFAVETLVKNTPESVAFPFLF